MVARKLSTLMAVFALIVMMVPHGSAQTVVPQPGTITVTGQGTASAPAEKATVIIVVGSNFDYTIQPADAMSTPTTAIPVVDVSSITAALEASGVSPENIEVLESQFNGDWGPGMPAQPITIAVAVDQPTVDGLAAMLTTVRSAAGDTNLLINQFGVYYTIADCRPLRKQARLAAMADAKDQATDQAAAMDVEIGRAVASSDSLATSPIYQTNSCTTGPVATPYSLVYSASPFDPALGTTVYVSYGVAVSYEIP